MKAARTSSKYGRQEALEAVVEDTFGRCDHIKNHVEMTKVSKKLTWKDDLLVMNDDAATIVKAINRSFDVVYFFDLFHLLAVHAESV